jgi:hypothetical protein
MIVNTPPVQVAEMSKSAVMTTSDSNMNLVSPCAWCFTLINDIHVLELELVARNSCCF